MAASAVPQTSAPLRILPGLSSAAQAAVDTDPAEIVKRWIANLSDGAKRKYRQAAREFCAWALHQENAVPEDARSRLIASYDPELSESEWALGYRWDIVLRGKQATPETR